MTKSVCGHSVVICPNGEGSPFDCESFCALCEGFGEYCETCGGKPVGLGCDEDNRRVIVCDCGQWACRMVKCFDCDDVLERDCESGVR